MDFALFKGARGSCVKRVRVLHLARSFFPAATLESLERWDSDPPTTWLDAAEFSDGGRWRIRYRVRPDASEVLTLECTVHLTVEDARGDWTQGGPAGGGYVCMAPAADEHQHYGGGFLEARYENVALTVTLPYGLADDWYARVWMDSVLHEFLASPDNVFR